MRWKIVVVLLVVCAVAPTLFVHFAGASVRAALELLTGMLSPTSAGAGHG